jgi:hypothetical protein
LEPFFLLISPVLPLAGALSTIVKKIGNNDAG